MTETRIKVYVDGREYSQQELENIYIDRSYYTLGEMKKLGATILDENSQELAEAQIKKLPAEKIRNILLDNKLRIGKDGLNQLYEDQYREADKMWSDILSKSADDDYSQKVARAHLIVTGLTTSKYLKIIGSVFPMKKFLLEMHPDHIDASMTNITEIMGMYGKPTQMIGSLKEKAPEPVAEDHNLRLIGASLLTSDSTKKNAIAMHQVKKLKGGLDILAGAYFPSATPQELIDGHSLHMAVEISNAFKNVL